MPKKRTASASAGADRYLQFIKKIHLAGLGMDAAESKIDRDAFAAAYPPGEKAPVEMNVVHEVTKQRADSFVILGRYRLAVKSRSGDELIGIQCTLSALFTVSGKWEQSLVERFAQNEVRVVFWPYLRHFLADTTYRMSITPLLLPLTSEAPTQA